MKISKAVISPATIIAILLMLINDHFLKGSDLLPGIITGKLSDIAFLFFIPILIAFIIRAKTKTGLVIAYIVPALIFIAINTIPAVSLTVESVMSIVIPTKLWPDLTDLFALLVLPVSMLFVLTRQTLSKISSGTAKRIIRIAVLTTAALTCIATSPREPELYGPVYMSWEEFRSSVKVEAPKAVTVKEQIYSDDPLLRAENIPGNKKIYIKDNYLYLSETNKGIHIIDITDPSKPEPKAFINIPGNVDIAIKGSALYADSFTDLLVFCLAQNPEDSVLVTRKENVFPYNPFQTKPNIPDFYYYGKIDKNKGVIIDWEQTDSRGMR